MQERAKQQRKGHEQKHKAFRSTSRSELDDQTNQFTRRQLATEKVKAMLSRKSDQILPEMTSLAVSIAGKRGQNNNTRRNWNDIN